MVNISGMPTTISKTCTILLAVHTNTRHGHETHNSYTGTQQGNTYCSKKPVYVDGRLAATLFQ